ncbi:MAG: type II 3-dehydroquinate dehydratase [Gammaproteobacteria bacterium]|nr:type II 3-dehydroquinate dehydratase [Gammaproteobacteria bacterium]MCP4474915.1 type II 3-dehydroquinate dehydratase [Gammaproteobacteria bacterium]
MKQILLLNGPNLNMLGQRDRHHYGTLTLQAIEALTAEAAKAYKMALLAYQSNHEGALIDKIQQQSVNCVGIIINPGALTHYSYALHDALLDSGLPVIEVHLSNIAEREPWRQHSVIAPACIAQIGGQKEQGYRLAVTKLVEQLSGEKQ